MKTKTTRKNKFLATLLLIAVLLTTLPTSAFAGTITKGNQTLSITEGLAALTVDGNEYKLTKPLVTTDCVIDNIGTVYLTVKGGNLYFCSYKYQGKNVDLIFLASGVTVLTETGYGTESGHNNFLTEEEIKSKLGISNNGTNNNGNNSNNSNNNSNNNGNTNNTSNQKKGVYLVGSNTVLYGDGTNTYVLLFNGKNVGEVAESNGTVYIRYTDGTIQTWKTASKGSTVVLTTIATSAKSLTKDSNGNVTGYITNDGKSVNFLSNNTTTNSSQYLAVQNGQATLLIWENNNISKTYSLASKDVVWGYQDSNKTCYLKKQDGSLWIWNYDLQKLDSKIKLLKVDSKVKDAIVSNNLIIGYTVDGNSTMKNTWSLDQVKVAIAIDSANSTTTKNNTNNNNTSTKTSKEYDLVHESGSVWYYLKDPKSDEIVDVAKFKNGIVTYNGKKYKATEMWFNGKKGRLIIKNNKLTQLVIRKGKSQKVKDISKITKCIITQKGVAKKLIKTNGNTINLAKY